MTDTLYKIVNGEEIALTSEDIMLLQAEQSVWEDGTIKRTALAEIARLEAEITPRRIREALLGKDNGWLSTQENKIITERAKLQGN